MAVFKCKMCGGSLDIIERMTVCECEHCGTQQTLPQAHDDDAVNLFNRANNLRSKSEFDKAQALFEKLVTYYPDDSESYWGLVLCKYGIEYVEDPATSKKIPTCHRTQIESVQTDMNFISAIEHADKMQRSIYEREGAEIDRLQKNILSIAYNEQPFDVFICYKETDSDGKRTPDAIIANDIYYQLTREGFKVFYAAITLENKLGHAYEPYIYAALHSAKVMLVIGTKPEYFDSVWIRNEWSRYLKIISQDRSKLIIPCYRDMNAYELPEEFAHLQAQDMSKIGFINDIIHGIKKVINIGKSEKRINDSASNKIENLLKRGALALEECKWEEAKRFYDQILDENVEEYRAYIGLLCAEKQVISEKDLVRLQKDFTGSDNYRKACRFGGKEVESKLFGYNQQGLYDHAIQTLESAKSELQCIDAEILFEVLESFKDSAKKIEVCREKARQIQYDSAVIEMEKANDEETLQNLRKRFEKLGDYRDSGEYLNICDKRIKDILEAKEQSRRNEEIKIITSLEEAEKERNKRNRTIGKIIRLFVAAAIIVFIVTNVIEAKKTSDYKKACILMDNAEYKEAALIFEKISGYSDVDTKIIECDYKYAIELYNNKEYSDALDIFRRHRGYKDTDNYIIDICKLLGDS